jgi:hypothetical protein
LIVAAISLSVIAVLVVTVMLLTRSSDHPGSAVPARSPGASVPEGHLVAGMTPQQVRHVAGRPTAVRGGCWFYRPKAGKVGSLSVGDPGSIAARTADLLKVCFYYGVFQQAFEHIPRSASSSRPLWLRYYGNQ